MALNPKKLQRQTLESNLLALGLVIFGGVNALPVFDHGKHESVVVCYQECLYKFALATEDLTYTNWGKEENLQLTPEGWLIPKDFFVVSHIAPENPFILVRTVLSTFLVALGCLVYHSHTKKLQYEYPKLFEQIKTEVIRDALIQQEIRNQEAESISQHLPSEFELQELEFRASKEKELLEATHELHLSELALATKKNLSEKQKLDKTASSKRPPGTQTSEQRKQEMIAALKEHEAGWLWELVDTLKPVFVVGSQGSWKSYFSATLALARWLINDVRFISITDPHFNKNQEESWKHLLPLKPEIYGGAQDWVEVAQGILAGFERWNSRTLKDPPLTSIWDEQTNWAKHQECKKQGEEFMGRVLSDPRKANEGPIIITHSFTNAGTGGGGGFSQAREDGVLRLHLNSNNRQEPTFKGKLFGLKDSDGDLIDERPITIPASWFNPEAFSRESTGSR